MKLTKDTAVETVQKWIASSITIEQLECCELFIQDTLYMRFGADQEVLELRLLVNTKKETLQGK